jgi:hypothetical protein
LSTNIRINHKGWVIFAKPLQEVESVGPQLVDYIVKYKSLGLAEELFRSALVKSSTYTYETFNDLQPHERESIVRVWLDRSLNTGLYEEPDIVY